MSLDLKDVTVAILAGGLGTRLTSILPGQQKVIAKVNEHPFLEYILRKLNKDGFKNVVICTGHLGHQVKEQFGDKYRDLFLSYSQEDSKLDTAGAVRLALPFLNSDHVMVTNGDSFFDCDSKKFWQFHLNKKSDATILLTKMDDTSRYGEVLINEDDRILAFQEKGENNKEGLINCGVYLFKRSILLEIPENRAVSFEKEMFPAWIEKNFYGFINSGRFIDIGTPDSFKASDQFFSSDPL